MDYWQNERVKEYVRDQGADAVLLVDALSDFEKSSRRVLTEDEVLVPVQGFENLFEVRIDGERGHHRLMGSIVRERLYLIHAFLKQGKRQEQRQYQAAWKRAKSYLVEMNKKKR